MLWLTINKKRTMVYAQDRDLRYYFVGPRSIIKISLDESFYNLKYISIGGVFLGEWNEM